MTRYTDIACLVYCETSNEIVADCDMRYSVWHYYSYQLAEVVCVYYFNSVRQFHVLRYKPDGCGFNPP